METLINQEELEKEKQIREGLLIQMMNQAFPNKIHTKFSYAFCESAKDDTTTLFFFTTNSQLFITSLKTIYNDQLEKLSEGAKTQLIQNELGNFKYIAFCITSLEQLTDWVTILFDFAERISNEAKKKKLIYRPDEN